jgi:2-polyprenyl-6-methoxyphenol hydroxylase-like FAD-dependent oxidoreductase
MYHANRSRHEVVIVGGRVAGSATALLLARLGHDVVVVDRASFPSDTLSTHSIARSGVVQLNRWGLLDAVLDSGAPAIRQITFHADGESVTRQVKHKAGVDLLVAPRRNVLDTILVTAAELAGATVRTGVTVSGVQRDDRGRVVGVHGHDRAGAGVEIGARFVIGADGLQSRVARAVGASLTELRHANGATQYAYYAGIPWPGIEFYPRRAGAGRHLPHPRRAGLHLDLYPGRGREGGTPPERNARRGVRRTALRIRPRARRAAARGPPHLAGDRHVARSKPVAPCARPWLGAGR